MRKWLLIILIIPSFCSWSQGPVAWKFSANKKADKIYEVHLTATMTRPWHIYSQKTPKGGPTPTEINFTKNPIIVLDGIVKEIGKLEVKHEDVFDIDVKYFDGSVDFVQTVKLKSDVKTNLNGTIQFMACTDQQCLPPTKTSFNIRLE
jgi:thiol:disulfide interchange protein DsbD